MGIHTTQRYSPSAQAIGKHLREVREQRNFEKQYVSDVLNISQLTLDRIEDGEIEIYLTEIYSLLCLYSLSIHEVFNGYFISEKILGSDAGNSNLFKNCNEYVADIISFHQRLNGGSNALKVVPLYRGKRTVKKTGSFSKRAAPSTLQRRAKETIQKHNLYKLPINVYQIAEDLGVKVSFEIFPNSLYMKLKGFCYKEEGFGLIGVNKNHPTTLQRFTVAHELHHYLYDFNQSRYLCGPANEQKAVEWNAERFSAELLMPHDAVQRLISNPNNVRYLTITLVASHFGVSYEAAAIRLADFNLLKSASQACNRTYRKKDKTKTQYLLMQQRQQLIAVFGLETGIEQLQLENQLQSHDLCGATLTDPSSTVCWKCGLKIHGTSREKSTAVYRQSPSNLSPGKVELFSKERQNYQQLSFNLDVSASRK
ncbi:MAG: ImmA/IrrE family metallo-endopeptidase [Cyanobacteria bacterium P01_F01_bin.150]